MRAWMQDSVLPQPQYDERPGRWIAEPRPGRAPDIHGADATTSTAGYLAGRAGGASGTRSPFPRLRRLGMRAQESGAAFGADGEAPRDQRTGRRRLAGLRRRSALKQTAGALRRAGAAGSSCASDKPVAFLCRPSRRRRSPTARSTRDQSYGHPQPLHTANSHETPEPLEPRRAGYDIRLQLDDLAQSPSRPGIISGSEPFDRLLADRSGRRRSRSRSRSRSAPATVG